MSTTQYDPPKNASTYFQLCCRRSGNNGTLAWAYLTIDGMLVSPVFGQKQEALNWFEREFGKPLILTPVKTPEMTDVPTPSKLLKGGVALAKAAKTKRLQELEMRPPGESGDGLPTAERREGEVQSQELKTATVPSQSGPALHVSPDGAIQPEN